MLKPEVNNTGESPETHVPFIAAELGSNVDLKCLAFLGHSNNTVKGIAWQKFYKNGSEIEFQDYDDNASARIYYEETTRYLSNNSSNIHKCNTGKSALGDSNNILKGITW